MTKAPKYPVGEQDFKALIEEEYIYIDKTQYIQKLLDTGAKFSFLARPRGFGKSLFLSTLRYFYEGQRHLFKGLAIDSYDWDWAEYPVLYLNLNAVRIPDKENFDKFFEQTFKEWEKKYGVDVENKSLSLRFEAVLEAAHKKTGKKAVILIDEYDKPLLGSPDEENLFMYCYSKLADIYLNFKNSSRNIKMVFLTGESCFFKLSTFSDLNNIDDITFDEVYGDLCGISDKELQENFEQQIKDLSKEMNLSYDEVSNVLREYYGGYRFSPEVTNLFYPSSLLQCFNLNSVETYKQPTDYSSLIAKALPGNKEDLKDLINKEVDFDTLRDLDIRSDEPLSHMWQAGYVTIKHYNEQRDLYLLGIPNKEVKQKIVS